MNKTFHLIYLSLLTAQSLALFMFESLLPMPFLAPGAKLGLANLITVIALYTLPRARDVLLVLLVRLLLATMFGGGPTILVYSLSGALISFAAMYLLKRSQAFSILGVSAAGGFFHNVGQLSIASIVIHNNGLWLYLPILGPMGIFTGLLIGWTAGFSVKKLLHFPAFQPPETTAPSQKH